MANIPYIVRHHVGCRPYFIVTTLAREHEDGFTGSWWVAIDAVTGVKVSYGHSEGVGGSGMSSAHMAIKNAKAACKRYHARCSTIGWPSYKGEV